jgi:hypothetical protein
MGFGWRPRHYPNRIPEKVAVARLMLERGGNHAVQPDDLTGLDFLLTRAVKQDAIDRFPGLGPDGADRLVSTDFFGVHDSVSRAKARNEAESSR